MKQILSNKYKVIFRGVCTLATLLLAIIFLTACNSKTVAKEDTANSTEASLDTDAEEKDVYPMTVTDELGNEITLTTKPTKIFAPVMEDSLLAIGIKPILQWSNGVKPQLYLQDQLRDVPEISFASGPPSAEAVMSYKPDLILLHNSHYADSGVYEKYAKIAPTYVFKNAPSDLYNSIKVLGQLVNEPERAEQALQRYQEKVHAAKTQLTSVMEGKKVALIRFNAKGMFFMSDDYFGGYVLTHELGFEQSNLVKNGAFEVSLEILPELDADYIFLINDGNLGDDFLKELKESSIWQNTAAVKNGQVYEASGDHWLNGGIHAHGKVLEEVVGFLAQ